MLELNFELSNFVLLSKGFELTPHPLKKNGASIVEVLPCLVRKS
jgi:hypothetical protein